MLDAQSQAGKGSGTHTGPWEWNARSHSLGVYLAPSTVLTAAHLFNSFRGCGHSHSHFRDEKTETQRGKAHRAKRLRRDLNWGLKPVTTSNSLGHPVSSGRMDH